MNNKVVWIVVGFSTIKINNREYDSRMNNENKKYKVIWWHKIYEQTKIDYDITPADWFQVMSPNSGHDNQVDTNHSPH